MCTSSGLPTTNLPLLPRRVQLPIALRKDLLLPPRQHAHRRNIADGAVQPDLVVVANVALIREGSRRFSFVSHVQPIIATPPVMSQR
jgi:hypothetical protein